MPKSSKKKHGTGSAVLDCASCGAQAVHVDVQKVIADQLRFDRCVLCWKPFKLTDVRIEHVHAATKDGNRAKWKVVSREINECLMDIFIGATEPESTALAHGKCGKRVLRHWPDVCQSFESKAPAKSASMDEVADKMIARGVHLQALEDLKLKLKESLTGLLKSVIGSSSEFGCPCASRVSNTLTELSEKFQKGEAHAGP